ncbi:MAG: hypothetical protein ACYC2Y_00925 [Armatimonadota bacterium]
MARPKMEWDPSWDDDWAQALGPLEDELADEHPKNPRQAVEMYRYGYAAGKQQPPREWSDVESNLYQDYMSGAPEPGQMEWDEASDYAERGFEAGRE